MRRAVWLLGLGQCVLWGVLYYSFAVFLVPIEHALGLSQTLVAGAFSLGLLAMASSAPLIGRWLDRGHARSLILGGVGLAVFGLLVVSQAHGIAMLYTGWLLLGLAMAALLYESAFALIIRTVIDPVHRLKALAAVTVMGGLASTIFLPTVALAVEHVGWRSTAQGCAVAVLLAGWVMERHVFPCLARTTAMGAPRQRGINTRWPAHFALLVTTNGLATLASMALTTLLIPLLQARGATPALAATVLAALGVAQLPGRIWLLHGGLRLQGRAFVLAPLSLQAIGLLSVALAPSFWVVSIGVAIFGLGWGLQTLVRPWLVQALYGVSDAGRWNGELARIQGYARATGPIAVAATAGWSSTPMVLAGMGGLLILTLPLARRLPMLPTA
ncbi:MFS transporter [Dyella subtropica]|uniref:MFS transporter n=1 Tax=Dyella subtropica TaxID=2992127 RepID=UPI002256F36F|nr:MFS transporter [Dyella subtropica]